MKYHWVLLNQLRRALDLVSKMRDRLGFIFGLCCGDCTTDVCFQ